MVQMLLGKAKNNGADDFFSVSSLMSNASATCGPLHEQCRDKMGLPNLAAVVASN